MHKLLVRYFTFCLSQLRQNSKNTIDWVLKQQTLLTVLEAGKSKIKVLADLVSGESLLPSLQMVGFSLVSSDKSERVSSSLFL